MGSFTMKSTLHTLSALLAVGLYMLLTAPVGDSQHVPSRCLCHKPKNRVQAQFKTFEVLLKRHGCQRVEIIVTLKKSNRNVCLSPSEAQGQHLLKCWHKMQKKRQDVNKCIKSLRRQGQKKRSQKKLIQQANIMHSPAQ